MAIDLDLARALHVEALRGDELHAEHAPHVLFQTSTIDALLDGAYEGDVSFAQLAEHGDLGLGTLDGCDGEMIAFDGRFWQITVDGHVHEVPPTARTPFAVVCPFEPGASVAIDGPLDQAGLLELVERHAPPDAPCLALRVDGRFAAITARSVPRQQPPYPPLEEVVRHQRVFELTDLDATLVGFRFPDYARGIEVPGWHLHALAADRRSGGHVLDCRIESGTLAIDRAADLHMELPAGVELSASAPDDAARRDVLRRVEHGA